MAVEYEYYSEHSGDAVDSGVSKGATSVQSISINGVPQTKDNLGIVDLPAYPTSMAFSAITGEVSDNTKLNTALIAKQDKNVGSAYANKIAYVDNNGDIAFKDDPLTATWGNLSGSINNQTDLTSVLATKVDKVTGKTLSTNDYDNTEKAEVAKIATINAKIPTEASSTNQLADKQYVADAIAANSGTFKGLFNNVADLPTTGNLNNDYAHVNIYNQAGTEIIGYSKYKWDGTQWLKEADIVTNTFTQAQNNAINSGITAGKVTAYDTHTEDTNNPHNVTKAQLGLDNVENVGSSATPTSGGTDNFTTGGAYIELNKKADKTNTIGSHTMADNITNQNLFDDIKDLVGTFTRKVIDGASNTLSNIALSSLANLGGANAGKPIVVGNDGGVVVGDNVPKYLDISDQISGNTYNANNGTFNHCKMCLQNDMVFYNVDYVLNTPVVDKQSAIRKVMELPDLSGQFAYPSKINVRITQAVCQPTSTENVNAWYVRGGDKYVDPTIFSNLQVQFTQTLPILEPCFTNSSLTDRIYIARQNKGNDGGYYWTGNKPIVTINPNNNKCLFTPSAQYDFDSLPYAEGTDTAPATGYYHNTSTDKWYSDGSEITVEALSGDGSDTYYPTATATHLNNYYVYTPSSGLDPVKHALLLKGIAGRNYYILKQYENQARFGGYNKIVNYYDQTGTLVTLPTEYQWWELIKVNLTIDSQYLYFAYLSDLNCPTSQTGNWGKYTIEPSLYNQYINVISTNLNYPLNHGAFGTATFTNKPITSATDVLTQGDVINNALYVSGSWSFDRIQIGAGGIM